MQTGFIIAGILFFLNPNVEIIDILPDFIGCALLLWGTRRLCACSEKGAAAGKAFRILLLLNLAKTISLLLFFIISESEMTWMLLLTSVFGILEAALFLYGLQMLHDTVLFTAMLHGKDGVYGKSLFRLFRYGAAFHRAQMPVLHPARADLPRHRLRRREARGNRLELPFPAAHRGQHLCGDAVRHSSAHPHPALLPLSCEGGGGLPCLPAGGLSPEDRKRPRRPAL